MTRPVLLTEIEASMVLSNWCMTGVSLIRIDWLIDRSPRTLDAVLDVLSLALHSGAYNRSRDRLAACIRVAPRRRP